MITSPRQHGAACAVSRATGRHERLWRDRNPDGGWVAGMAVIVVSVLMVLAGVTVLSVGSSAAAARRNADALVARATALSGVELFFAAIDEVPASTWLPPCAVGSTPACTDHADVFPPSLTTASGGSWVQMVEGGVTPCAEAGTPIETTCIRMADTLEPDPGSPPGVGLYQITLQVDALTNCRRGAWSAAAPGTAPGDCVYARVLQRFTPRQYAHYLDYTGSELLDPALWVGDGGSYQDWLAACTTGDPPAPVADTVAAAEAPSVCATPAYLGAGTVAGSATASPGDVLNGPVATNDQTVYSCNSATAPPAATGIEAVSAVPSAELPATVTGPGPGCPGPPPGGTTVPAAPPPPDDSSLAAAALPADVFGTPARPVSVTITFLGRTPGASGYEVDGGPLRPWPGSGVVYVYGQASVRGQVCLPVTLGTAGSIEIVGNLSDAPGCAGAVTGLVATDGVSVVPAVVRNQVACWPDPVAGQCMTVQAAIIALGAGDLPENATPAGGSFSLAGWDRDASPLGTGGACRYDAAVAAADPTDVWALTDTRTRTAAWTGTGLDDTGQLGGPVSEGVTPGPLACDPASPAMGFAPSSSGPGGDVSTPVGVDQLGTVSVAAWFDAPAPGTGPGGGGPVVALGNAPDPGQATASTDQIWLDDDGRIDVGAPSGAGPPPVVSTPAGTDYADGHWHFVVATVTPAAVTLFVDGRPVASVAAATVPATGYWWIGAMRDAPWWPGTGSAGGLGTFTGDIGRVAVFPYALGTAQVAALYNSAQQDPDRCAGFDVCGLTFLGSFYERFRGAFGTYTTGTAGPVTETGTPKHFSFDPRLDDTAPPYFLGPISGGWLRSGTSVTGALGP